MYPHTHIIISLIFFSLIFFIFPILGILPVSLMFISSILIDVDHYLFYLFKKKDSSLSNAYHWHANLPRNHKPIMHIFHTIEFLIVVAILSLYSSFFLFILAGMLFHSLLDIIELIYDHRIESREYFLIRYLIRDKSRYY